MTGPPVALYHGRPGDTVDVEAGFPVAAQVAPDGEVEPGELPGGPAVEMVHEGPYETLAWQSFVVSTAGMGPRSCDSTRVGPWRSGRPSRTLSL